VLISVGVAGRGSDHDAVADELAVPAIAWSVGRRMRLLMVV
jgi:hypothetical protein